MRKIPLEQIFKPDEYPVRSFWRDHRWPFRLHFHPEIEIHFIKAGKGIYWINGRNYEFRGNSCLLMRPGEVHGFVSGEHCRRCLLLFAPDTLRNAQLPQDCLKDIPSHLRVGDREAAYIEFAFNRIIEERANPAFLWQDMLQTEVKMLLLLIRRIARQPQAPSQAHPLAAQLTDYIEAHFQEALRVPNIARLFGFSASHLTRTFKQHVGVGLKHYILQRRIVEAQKLLESHPEIKVSAISEQVGFTDSAIFERAFRAITRMTPTEYRQIRCVASRK
jgi:AraC-like DNA-binding protein